LKSGLLWDAKRGTGRDMVEFLSLSGGLAVTDRGAVLPNGPRPV